MAGHRTSRSGPQASSTTPATVSGGFDGVGKAARSFSQADALKRAIREHVVPTVKASEPAQTIPGLDAATFFNALIKSEELVLASIVPTLIEHNIKFELFHRVLLQPIFDLMQDGWAADELDFLTIDLSTARLQMICNHFVRERLKRRGDGAEERRTVLFAQATDSNHSMGLSVARSFFMDAGWSVEGGAHVSPKAGLYETIGTSHYDVLALSSGHASKTTVRDVVTRARRSSLNGEIAVCVGGASVSQEPHAFDDVGADVIALNAAMAVAETESVLGFGA
ncbi:MAG: hypothetical protein AAFO77_01955 [Pseudomonadota bacterium]